MPAFTDAFFRRGRISSSTGERTKHITVHPSRLVCVTRGGPGPRVSLGGSCRHVSARPRSPMARQGRRSQEPVLAHRLGTMRRHAPPGRANVAGERAGKANPGPRRRERELSTWAPCSRRANPRGGSSRIRGTPKGARFRWMTSGASIVAMSDILPGGCAVGEALSSKDRMPRLLPPSTRVARRESHAPERARCGHDAARLPPG